MKFPLLFPAVSFVGALAFTACMGTGQPPTATATLANASPPSPQSGSTARTAAPPALSSFKETAKADPAKVVPYPFTTCAVIRKDLEGSPKYRRVYKNQEVLFCCTPCLRSFDANPEPYMPRIIAAAAAKARGEAVHSGW